jgi:hypothetical protein
MPAVISGYQPVRLKTVDTSTIASSRIGRSAAGERPCDWRSTPTTRRPAASSSTLGPNISMVPNPPWSSSSGSPSPKTW